jgi:hypothetical protein
LSGTPIIQDSRQTFKQSGGKYSSVEEKPKHSDKDQ